MRLVEELVEVVVFVLVEVGWVVPREVRVEVEVFVELPKQLGLPVVGVE